jgi:tetratricopeptide (TPR) repeat protein
LILRALASQGSDPPALIKFVNLLTAHEEPEDAARWLDKLDEVLSKAPLTVADRYRVKAGELRARLLAKNGQPEQAVDLLNNVIPRPLSSGQLPKLEEAAVVLEELKQYDAAERLLDEYMSQDPRGTIAKAAYVGRRGDLNKAFSLLDDARKNQPITAILPSALDALRRHPEQAKPERFRTLEEWTKTGLRTETDVAQVKLLQAEMYDLQGRYDEVIAIYRELLGFKQASPMQIAIVKNNLAFILALTRDPKNVAEAIKLTEDAMRVMGPVSDLLDTRALALMAQGKVEQAVVDLRSASADIPPSAAKFFHLAQAEKQANNVEAARNALAQAQQIGVDLNRFTPVEKKSYLQLVDDLK